MSLNNVVTAQKLLNTLSRERAETLYVLAVLNAKSGYQEVAAGYARECIKSLKLMGTDTLEECTTNLVCLEGVFIPEFLHEDVVRANLRALKVKL